ncbi:retrotransposon-related protein [Trifolium pratense]|uniref:Retrotransposon-related protein n=1 Tax=Trifolium pratense TaxID=57577 RepID=A0A2K3K0A1_TRIPR|nr:retrotransposon-related protein [Trifolium pratense]
MVLVDSGASHNFISSKLATALELPITQMAARKRKIKLGDGHKVLSQGVCEGVKVNLGSIEVSVDALVLDLGGLDVILGVSWLCTLGQVMMDWKTLTMQFWSDGKSITLQGQRKNMAQNCYLNSFLEGRQEGLGGDWWIPQIEKANSGMSMKHELNGVLHQFATVFQDNIRLPPERPQVHYIKLFPDHGPVSVRPYRYPHHQKEEIENIGGA